MRRFRWFRVALGLAALASIAPGTRAATIVVTTVADPAPAGCGLRDAILAANADAPSGGCTAGSGADVIDLGGLTGVISVGAGSPPAELPALSSAITLRGPGADRLAISGNEAVRNLVGFSFSSPVVVEGVTLREGRSAGSAYEPGYGGCVLTFGPMVLREVRLTACGGQGALYVMQNLTRLERVLVDDNLFEGVSVGGITGAGGIVIESSTFSSNGSFGLALVNFDGPGPFARVFGSTFADNATANLYVPVYAGEPGEFPLTLNHVVLANAGPTPNCAGQPVVSEGHNVADDASCALGAAGDLANVDPMLAALADHGGPTPTHALQGGSPAIDSGAAVCPGLPTDLVLDQRGFARPADGDGNGSASCDRGAFEVPEPQGAAAAALFALGVLARRAFARR